MTLLNRQLFYGLALFALQLLSQQQINGELAATGAAQIAAAPINALYDNLLQREYAGPVVFPNHQVERKAQRSPSLRLRFGRSDPDMLNSLMEKRWFGDVNQKPIRSPSLRLRFGRRSDPNMPRHSSYDDLLERELALNDAADADDYNEAALYNAYERVVRKPQRLRWGRSVPYEANGDANTNINNNNNVEDIIQNEPAALYNLLLKSDKLRRVLMGLRQYDGNDMDFIDAAGNAGFDDGLNEIDGEEYQRVVRKPAPLRLRWGRSTGGAPSAEKLDKVNAEPQPTKAQN